MAIQTATNPQTGETVALVNGQWVPVGQTATNDQGQKAYLVNNQWMTDQPAAVPEEQGFIDRLGRATKRGFGELGESAAGIALGAKAAFGQKEAAGAQAEQMRKESEAERGQPAPISFAELEQTYGKEGAIAALKKMPAYVAEQILQSAPSMAIPLAAGAAAGAVSGPFAPIAAPIAGIGAYGVQQFGQFMKRQAEEGATGETLEPGKAAMTAAATAPIGYFADRLTLGMGKIPEKVLGKQIADELARRTGKTIAGRAATGATVGVIAEAPTEVLEQAAERWQAGLSLKGEDAMREYKEAFFGAAAVGGVGGAASRAMRKPPVAEAPAPEIEKPAPIAPAPVRRPMPFAPTSEAAALIEEGLPEEAAPAEDATPQEVPVSVESPLPDVAGPAKAPIAEPLAEVPPTKPLVEAPPVGPSAATPEPPAQPEEPKAVKPTPIELRRSQEPATEYDTPEQNLIEGETFGQDLTSLLMDEKESYGRAALKNRNLTQKYADMSDVWTAAADAAKIAFAQGNYEAFRPYEEYFKKTARLLQVAITKNAELAKADAKALTEMERPFTAAEEMGGAPQPRPAEVEEELKKLIEDQKAAVASRESLEKRTAGTSLMKVLQGALSNAEMSELGGRSRQVGKNPFMSLVAKKGKPGSSMDDMVDSGILDLFLPPNMRPGQADYENDAAAEYIREKLRSNKFYTYETEFAVQLINQDIEYIENQIQELLSDDEINKELQYAANEQREIDQAPQEPATKGEGRAVEQREGEAAGKEQLKLEAPTKQDVADQEERKAEAPRLDEEEQIRKESEAGAGQFKLTGEDGRQDTTGGLFDQPEATPKLIEISAEEERKTALNKFKKTLSTRILPFRSRGGDNRVSVIKPSPLNKELLKEILKIVSDALNLGLPPAVLGNVTAAGSTRSDAIAMMTSTGWLMTGSQWKNTSEPEKLQGIIHELGHAVDTRGGVISDGPKWAKAHNQLQEWYNKSEKSRHPFGYPFSPGHRGKVRIKRESFAQSFGYYFTSPEDLQTNAPEAYSQIQSIVERIQDGSQKARAAGKTEAGTAGIEIQPTRSAKGEELQPDTREVGAAVGATKRLQDRGAGAVKSKRLFFSDLLFKEQSESDKKQGYANRFNNPVTLKDGSRLSGFTDPKTQTTFHGYDKNGERFTQRAEDVNPSDIVFSKDANKTANKVREALQEVYETPGVEVKTNEYRQGKPTPTQAGQEALAILDSTGMQLQPPGPGRIQKIKETLRAIGENPELSKTSAKAAVTKFLDKMEVAGFSGDAAFNNDIRRNLQKDFADNPEVLGLLLEASQSQAVHSDALATRFIVDGGIAYDKETKKWVSVKKEHNFIKLAQQIEKAAKKYGLTKEQMEQVSHTYFVAKRFKDLLKKQRNRDAEVDRLNEELASENANIKQYTKDGDFEKLRTSERAKNDIKSDIAKLEKAKVLISEDQRAMIEPGMSLAENMPELEEISDTWQGIRTNAVKAMVDGGLWSMEFAEDMLDEAAYVPFYRDEQLDMGGGPQEFIKGLQVKGKEYRLKGSNAAVNDIFDNMVRWTQYAINRSVRNHKALQMVDIGTELQVGDRNMAEKVKEMDAKKNTIRVFRNGTQEIYSMADPLYVEAFSSISNVTIPSLKFFTWFSNLLRQSVVLYPLFSLAQIPQDSFSAMFTSGLKTKYALRIPVLAVKEFLKTLNKTSATHKLLESYGATGVRDFNATVARNDIQIAAGLRGEKGMVGKVGEFLGNVAMAADNSIRQAVYEASMQQGLSKSEAIEKAFDIINFRRRGTSKLINLAGQTVPFFYAYMSVQRTAYKTITGVGISPQRRKEALATLAMTSGAVMALSLFYTMMNGGDEEYEKTPTAVRDRTLNIPGTGFMRIPLRPDLFLLPKVITEHVYHLITDSGFSDGAKFRKSIAENIANAVLSPQPIPQAVKPVLEVAINYDFFQGRPLIGQFEKKKEAERQFNDNTSEFSKMLGSFGASPIAADHLIRGMFGSAGGLFLYMTNFMINSDPDVPRPELSFREALAALPGTGGFVTKPNESALKADFYALRDEVEKVKDTYNDIKLRSPQELEQFLSDEKNIERLGLAKSTEKVGMHLSKIRRAIAQITNAPEDIYSAGEKRTAIKELREVEKDMLKSINLPELRKMANM